MAGIHASSVNVPITDAFGASVSGMRQVGTERVLTLAEVLQEVEQ